MKYNKIYTQLLIISLLFFAGCGRKQKNIFSFEPEPKIRVTKLDLPAVRGLSITKKDGFPLLTWFDLSAVARKSDGCQTEDECGYQPSLKLWPTGGEISRSTRASFNQKNNTSIKSLQENFVGYDVFKLTKQNFIPKHPLNKNPLTETQFWDKNKKSTRKTKTKSFYLIQPVFKFDNQLIKGPSSQIVGIEN